MKCDIYDISFGVFTVCQRTPLVVSGLKRVKCFIKLLAKNEIRPLKCYECSNIVSGSSVCLKAF